MLETYRKKVEKIAEEYADLISKKIAKEENFNDINEGIRMLNHVTCTLNRIDHMQQEAARDQINAAINIVPSHSNQLGN